jgi:hypothetical protein
MGKRKYGGDVSREPQKGWKLYGIERMTGRKVVLEIIEDKKSYTGIVEPTFPLAFNFAIKKVLFYLQPSSSIL